MAGAWSLGVCACMIATVQIIKTNSIKSSLPEVFSFD